MHTVKAVAGFAGISVRTLHHYDAIGLLRPESVSDGGYRLYNDRNLERLQEILFFRELGFSLNEIQHILESPVYDRKYALLSHRKLLGEKERRIGEMIRTIDRTIEALERGERMENDQMFAAFDEKQLEEYREEVRQKYGTKALEESDRRTAGYSKADWDTVKAEADSIWNDMAALMDRNPGDREVQATTDRFYRHLNQRFYTVTREIFSGLAEMYVTDQRFTAFYERIQPGLAVFVHDAIKIYCENLTE